MKEGRTYFHALVWGKKRAGIHAHEMYEPDLLNGATTYFTLLGGHDIIIYRKWYQFWKPKLSVLHKPIPRPVVEYLKKEIFKGLDAEQIEKCYQMILKE